MSQKISRRQFVKAAVGAGAAAAVARSKPAQAIVVSSRNGNEFKNGGSRTAIHEAYLRILHGEANLFGLSSFFVVEEMRRGAHPKDAIAEALRRIRLRTVEKRLLKPDGTPIFDVKFYAINVSGEHAGMAMYAGTDPKYAVCDEAGPRLASMDALFPGKPAD